MTAFAEFQDVGGVMLADPSLTENANVNVVFNNDAGADYPNYYIIMGNATETPLPLSSITSQIINVNASNGIFVGGSLMGSVSGDIRNQQFQYKQCFRRERRRGWKRHWRLDIPYYKWRNISYGNRRLLHS